MLVILFTLAVSMSLISCSQGDKGKSATESHTYTGYISIEDDTLKIDDFEFITSEDEARIKELGLSQTDMPNGYYIHNESEEVKSFKIDKDTKYTFFDLGNLFVKEEDDKKYTTTSKQDFITFLYGEKGTPSRIPFEIVALRDTVISITEIFVN